MARNTNRCILGGNTIQSNWNFVTFKGRNQQRWYAGAAEFNRITVQMDTVPGLKRNKTSAKSNCSAVLDMQIFAEKATIEQATTLANALELSNHPDANTVRDQLMPTMPNGQHKLSADFKSRPDEKSNPMGNTRVVLWLCRGTTEIVPTTTAA